jgi:hypothetical protein
MILWNFIIQTWRDYTMKYWQMLRKDQKSTNWKPRLRMQNDFSKNFTSKTESYIQGEKISIYQIGIQERRWKKTPINKLQHDGETIEDPIEVKHCIENYFSNLFTPHNNIDNNTFIPSKTIPANNNFNDDLMQHLNEDEIFRAIHRSAAK